MIAIKHDCRGYCDAGCHSLRLRVERDRRGFENDSSRLRRRRYHGRCRKRPSAPSAIAGFRRTCRHCPASEDPDAASLPFDRRRGGFVIGEGSGRFRFGRIREMRKLDGAKIYGEVCGYGSTCDAVSYHSASSRGDEAAHRR